MANEYITAINNLRAALNDPQLEAAMKHPDFTAALENLTGHMPGYDETYTTAVARVLEEYTLEVDEKGRLFSDTKLIGTAGEIWVNGKWVLADDESLD